MLIRSSYIRRCQNDFVKLEGDPFQTEGVAQSGYLICLEASDGTVGHAPIRGVFAHQALKVANTLLVGEDARAIASHWKRMSEFAQRDHHGTLNVESLAALDIALWDLRAKIHGVPLFREIGGANSEAPIMRTLKVPETAAKARKIGSAMSKGHQVDGCFMFCLQLSGAIETDIQGIKACQAAMNKGIPAGVLGVESIGLVAAKDTSRYLAALEKYADLAFSEGPATYWDTNGYRQVSNEVRAAICNGHGLATLADFYPFFSQRALDIVQIDIHRSGITLALQLADAAYGYELPVILAESVQGVAAHLAGAIPYIMGVRLPAGDEVLVSGAAVLNGRIQVAESSGAGWQFQSIQKVDGGELS